MGLHHHHSDQEEEHEHRSIASLLSKFEGLAHGHHGSSSTRPSASSLSPTNGASAAPVATPVVSPIPSKPPISASSSTGSLSDTLKRAPPSSFRPPPNLAPKPQLKPSRQLDSPSVTRTPSPTSSTGSLPPSSFPIPPPSLSPAPSSLRSPRPPSPAKAPEAERAAAPPPLGAATKLKGPPKAVPRVSVRHATLEVDTRRAADADDDAPVSVSALRERFGQTTSGPAVRAAPAAFAEPQPRVTSPAGNGTVASEGTQSTSSATRMGPPPVPAKPAHRSVADAAQPQTTASHSKGPAPLPPQSRSTSHPASRTASPVPETSLAPAPSAVRPTSPLLSGRPPPPPIPRAASPTPLTIPTSTSGPEASLPQCTSPQRYSHEPASLESSPRSSPQPTLITPAVTRRPAPPRPVSPQPVVVLQEPTPSSASDAASPVMPIKPPLPLRKQTLPVGVIDAPPPLPSNKPPPSRSATLLSPSSSDSNIFKPPLPGNKPSAPTIVSTGDPRPTLPQRPRGDSIGSASSGYGTGTPTPRRPLRQATVHSLPSSTYSSPPPTHRPRGASISAEPGYVPPPPPPLRTAGQSSGANLSRSQTISGSSRLEVRGTNGGSLSPGRTTPGADSDYDDEEGSAQPLPSAAQRGIDEYPDSTYANKRPPIYGRKGTRIKPPEKITSFAVLAQYVAVGHTRVLVYDVTKTDEPILNMDQKDATGLEGRSKDNRVTALGFRPSRDPACEGRYLWCGNKDGHLWEIDVEYETVTAVKPNAHPSAVTHIMRHEHYLLTLDDTGKLQVWEAPESSEKGEASNLRLFRTMRVSDRVTLAKMIKGKLWTATAPVVRSTSSSSGVRGPGVRGPTVRVYEPCTLGNAPPPRTSLTPEWTGSATSATVVPLKSDLVYMGHEGGFVTLWHLAGTELECVQVLKVSANDICALEGVGDHLWAGKKNGQILVWNIDQLPWTTSNMWSLGKDEPIRALVVDPRAIPTQSRLPLWSVTQQAMYSWDGLRAVNWIDKRMTERQPDYCTFREVRVLVVSWNIDSAKPSDLATGGIDNTNFLSQVLGSVDSPDIIVFGFQEVVPLTDKKVTAKTLLFGSKGKEGGGATKERVSGAYRAWADKLTVAVRLASPGERYTKVQSEQLVGLFTCVFTKDAELNNLKDIVITTVKRGIAGIYGNKGAIVARMVLDDTSLCFINVHLAAGQQQVPARNADLAAIMEDKDIFPPSKPQWYAHGGNGEAILDHEMVVLNGDLNYRIGLRREPVESNVLDGNINYLLENDQLRREMRGNHKFRLRAFAEAPITFMPTYKYDPGTNTYDTSEKRRVPAWCDRVLFTKSPRINSINYRRYEVNVSDHRPVSAGLECQVKSIDMARATIVRGEIDAAWKVYQEERLKTMAKAYAGWY